MLDSMDDREYPTMDTTTVVAQAEVSTTIEGILDRAEQIPIRLWKLDSILEDIIVRLEGPCPEDPVKKDGRCGEGHLTRMYSIQSNTDDVIGAIADKLCRLAEII